MGEGIAAELQGLSLGDERLNKRSRKVIEALAANPEASVNAAMNGWADTQAAYRLFNNSKASTSRILKPHREATAQRMAGCGGAVLVMQDTVFFSYGTHVKTRGLGPIGKSNAAHDRGLIPPCQ